MRTHRHPQDSAYYKGNQRKESHLWLSDSAVLLGGSQRNPIRPRSSNGQAYSTAHHESKVGKSNVLAAEVVGRGRKRLGLDEIDTQERIRSGPHCHRRPEDDGKEENLKRGDNLANDGAKRPSVKCLENAELLHARPPSPHPLKIVSGCGVLYLDRRLPFVSAFFGLFGASLLSTSSGVRRTRSGGSWEPQVSSLWEHEAKACEIDCLSNCTGPEEPPP